MIINEKPFLGIAINPKDERTRRENVVSAVASFAKPLLKDDHDIVDITSDNITFEDLFLNVYPGKLLPSHGLIIAHGSIKKNSFIVYDKETVDIKSSITSEYFKRRKDSYKFVFFFGCHSACILSSEEWHKRNIISDWLGFDEGFFFYHRTKRVHVIDFSNRFFKVISEGIKLKLDSEKLKEKLDSCLSDILLENLINHNDDDGVRITFLTLRETLRCKTDRDAVFKSCEEKKIKSNVLHENA